MEEEEAQWLQFQPISPASTSNCGASLSLTEPILRFDKLTASHISLKTKEWACLVIVATIIHTKKCGIKVPIEDWTYSPIWQTDRTSSHLSVRSGVVQWWGFKRCFYSNSHTKCGNKVPIEDWNEDWSYSWMMYYRRESHQSKWSGIDQWKASFLGSVSARSSIRSKTQRLKLFSDKLTEAQHSISPI